MLDIYPAGSDVLPDRIRRLERRVARESNARKEAERLLEQKSLELFALNRNLTRLNAELEQRVQQRTLELERERHQAQEQAYSDPLTGLANRLMLNDYLQRNVCCLPSDSHITALHLDLDGFKAVNDTLGHLVGDEVLRVVSARLRQCVRKSDVVARVGGDEFVILQVHGLQADVVISLAERLIRSIQAPLSIRSHQIVIDASIGIATASTAATEVDSLLRDADIALHIAKAEGRGTWRAFRPEMNQQIQARRRLEVELRCAVAEKQFEVFYQPLQQVGTGDLVGFEALLRWNHPERGRVSPAEFMPLLEETALIKPLGVWVLEKACHDAAKWPSHLKIAINLSPVQFVKGTLAEDVRRALDISGLPAERLELEITESVMLENSDETLNLLNRIRAFGVQISMDDFGTGYSSLSYLRRFPFDKIKIDQFFVRTLKDGKGSLEIIRAVVGLGRALNMKILAEGVETLEQLAILRAEGCDEVQGYLFSKPVPIKKVWSIITKDKTRRIL
jgi:diguanylate cyclase (GGDEF)-like protein